MNDPQSDTKLLQDAIVEVVKRNWDANKTAILVARVGQLLRYGSFENIEELKRQVASVKLSNFVEEKLTDRVHLYRSPSNPTVAGLVPYGIQNSDALFPQSREQSIDGAPPTRFENRVWAAFWRPLAESSRRFLLLSPFPRYLDLADGESIPPDSHEVTRDYIFTNLTAPPAAKAAAISDSIMRWCAATSVPPHRLERGRGGDASTASSPAKSALDILIRSLSASELQRVELPLDIVKKLLESKAS